MAEIPKFLPEDFKPYWVEEMDIDDYHSKKDFVSSGGLRLIEDKSPRHFHHRICEGESKRPSEAQEFGRLVHVALLEPKRFAKNLILEPTYNKRSSIEREKMNAWRAQQGQEAIIVEKEDLEAIVAIRRRIEQEPIIKGLLTLGKREWSGFGRDAETGIGIRARPDFFHAPDENFPHGIIMDVKTTTSCKEENFTKTIVEYNYHLSLYFYRKVAEAIEGCQFPLTYILAVEKTPPYEMELFPMTDGMYEETAEFLYKETMQTLKYCIETNHWHGYRRSSEPKPISPPYWYEQKMRVRMDMREAEGAMNG